MGSTLFIWGVLIGVFISRADAYKCLSCTSSARPRDCEYVQECGQHEKCSIESYLRTSGYIRYSLGCMDSYKCAAFGRKRTVLNATVLDEIKQKNTFGLVHEEQWDEYNRDTLLCADCCDTDLCNAQGCGEPGYPSDSGPICYSCVQKQRPDACNQIKMCSRDDACHLSYNIVGIDTVFQSECTPKQACQQLGTLDIGPYTLVGRRRRKSIDMKNRRNSVTQCNKCCTNNLCNFDNCTSVTQINIVSTPPPTQAPTSLPPVTCVEAHITEGVSLTRMLRPTAEQRIVVKMLHLKTHGEFGLNEKSNLPIAILSNLQPGISLSDLMASGHYGRRGVFCSQTCGTGGIAARQRNCSNPAPFAGGKGCVGNHVEMQPCSGPSDPQVVQSVQNFTQPTGSQIVIHCLVSGSAAPAQAPQITWTAPQIVGHPIPTNVAQIPDGSLRIDGLTVENVGPYSCTLTTACGKYDSPKFWVSIQ